MPVYVFEVGALDKRKTDKYAKEGDRAEPRLIALYEVRSPAGAGVVTPELTVPLTPWRPQHMVQFVLPFCSAVPHQHPETPISGCATIVDVSNVSLMRFWALKAHMQRASVLATARYAETLGAIYLVGAPSFFATVWGWVKNWFDPSTVDKINILAAGTMLQDLEARIPRESIPRKYGGELDWAYGARGPALDDEARRTMGAREGEDVAGLLSAPVRWVDGKVVLKGKGRSDAELERWNDGGRTDAGTEPAGRGEPAERGATAAAAAAAAPSATLNGDAHAEEEIEPAPQPSPPASSAPSSSSPSPSPAPASAFASSTTSTPASTTTHTTPRTDDSSAVLPPSSASVSTSALPPPILGAGYSNARPASSSPSHSLAATPAPKAAEQGHAKGEEEQHDIHVAARENPAAPVKDLAAALEGTTL